MQDQLAAATKWVRKEMKRREDSAHPSHRAAKILAEADDRFQLGSFGVEGWAKSMQNGVQYLNFGDPYVPTIVVRTFGGSYRCSVARGGWAVYA